MVALSQEDLSEDLRRASVGKDGPDWRTGGEAFPAFEKGEFDEERHAGEGSPELVHEIGGGYRLPRVDADVVYLWPEESRTRVITTPSPWPWWGWW